MIIGIDFDGVLFDTESFFRTYAEIFDIMHNGTGMVACDELRAEKSYAWGKDMFDEYIQGCLLESEKKAQIMPYAKEIIDMLISEGHSFVGISSRGILDKEEIEITKERLKSEGIVLKKILFCQSDKLKACLDEKVDVMIEDFYDIVDKLSDNGITCLYFKDIVTKSFEKDNVVEVKNWGEVYRAILKLSKK